MSESNFVNVLCLNSAFISKPSLSTILKELLPGMESADKMNEADIQHLLGKWLMLKLLNGVPDALNKTCTNKFGKPFISDAPGFNISHTRNAVVCASTSCGEIGIDIEFKRSLDWHQYEESFSTTDWKTILFSNNPSFKLLELWTKKESLLKADGRGFQIPLSNVILNDHYGWLHAEQRRWYIKPVPIEGFFCHIATEFPVQHIYIQHVHISANGSARSI